MTKEFENFLSYNSNMTFFITEHFKILTHVHDPLIDEVPLSYIIPQKIPGKFISFYTQVKYSANFIFFNKQQQ